MSKQNSSLNKLSREEARAQAIKLKEQEASRRKRTVIIAVGVAVAIIAGLGALAYGLLKSDGSAQTAAVGEDGLPHGKSVITAQAPKNLTSIGGISLGKDLVAGTANEGAKQIDIFFDYACSHCFELEADFAPGLVEAAKKGEVTLVYHPLAFMDPEISPKGAAIETYVAANEPKSYLAVHQAMHKNIIAPLRDGTLTEYPSIDDYVKVAKEAGLSDSVADGLAKALESDELNEWVEQVTQQFSSDSSTYRDDGKVGTPTVFVDGKMQSPWADALSAYGSVSTQE